MSRLFSTPFRTKLISPFCWILVSCRVNKERTCPSNEEEFRDLAERFRAAKDPAEAERLGDQLGRMIFGG